MSSDLLRLQRERDEAQAEVRRLLALVDGLEPRPGKTLRDEMQELTDVFVRLEDAAESILNRPMPDGNASAATEIERIKHILGAALPGQNGPMYDPPADRSREQALERKLEMIRLLIDPSPGQPRPRDAVRDQIRAVLDMPLDADQ